MEADCLENPLGLGLTLRPCELSEGGQGNEGVRHRERGVQNTGGIIGLTGLYTANDVGALKPGRSKGENKHTHAHGKKNTQKHTHGL